MYKTWFGSSRRNPQQHKAISAGIFWTVNVGVGETLASIATRRPGEWSEWERDRALACLPQVCGRNTAITSHFDGPRIETRSSKQKPMHACPHISLFFVSEQNYGGMSSLQMLPFATCQVTDEYWTTCVMLLISTQSLTTSIEWSSNIRPCRSSGD
jgi:hypothetical protein